MHKRCHLSVFAGKASGAACLVVLLTAGCSSKSEDRYLVKGLVTIDGAPVVSGRIDFFPAGGRPATSLIGSDGSYEIESTSAGPYRVTVTSRAEDASASPLMSMRDEIENARAASGRPPAAVWLVPQRYSQRSTSGLTVELEGKSATEANFELKTQP